jgi:hypothetical protein
MKKAIRKIISFVLIFTLTASSAALLSSVKTGAYPGRVPVIFISGEGTEIGIKQDDGKYRILKYQVDTDKIKKAFLDDPSVIVKASFTQDWTEFSDILADVLIDTFGEFALDENGEPTNGSESTFKYNKRTLKNNFTNPNASLYSYGYSYDWRLSPYENMEGLRQYIDDVLEATGCNEYVLYSRCEGGCLSLLYYDMYKDNRISDLILSHTALLGLAPIGEAFSGNIKIDPEAVERLLYETDLGINYELTDNITLTDDLIRQVLKVLIVIYGADMFCFVSTNAYQHIYDYVNEKILKYTFGSFPGYWAMVEEQYYEQAKKSVFAGEEEKYAGMIEKIDRYYNNITVRTDEILDEMEANGIRICNIIKYGKQICPGVPEADILSDQLVKVPLASFGATTSPITSKFSDKYIQEEEAKGNGKYISPDKQINSATCKYRDTTWYVKNVGHKFNPKCIEPLVFAIANDHESTVFTYEDYPQYLFYSEPEEEGGEGTLAPLDPEIHRTRIDDYNDNVGNTFIRKFKEIFRPLFVVICWIVKVFGVQPRAGK